MYWVRVLTVNVALNKPTYQEFPYRPGNDHYDASNAVDGHKSELYYIHGSGCAVSYLNQTATWWVNLTKIHSIHHITIYFRTDIDGKFIYVHHVKKWSNLFYKCNNYFFELQVIDSVSVCWED